MLGDFQHRLYLPFDPGLQRDLMGGVQQIGDQIDIGRDETRQYVFRVDFRQMNGGMKMWELCSSCCSKWPVRASC